MFQLEVLSEAILMSNIFNDTTNEFAVAILNYIVSTNTVLTVYYSPSYS